MPTKRKVLPKADFFGNYWFGDKPEGPAIFSEKVFKSSMGWVKTGYYFVSLGEKGMVWAGANLKRFKYIQEAVDVLEELG